MSTYLNTNGIIVAVATLQGENPLLQVKKAGVYVMHRVIMKAPEGKYVDHINGNRLDNRKTNLRFCTHAQNIKNQKATISASKYKGVARTRDDKRWMVCIQSDGVYHYLGQYLQEKVAAAEYDKLARLLHGEFACLNFPKDGEQGCL